MREFINITNNFANVESVASVMEKFYNFVVEFLVLPECPNVSLEYNSGMEKSFGSYNLDTRDIRVEIMNRHPIDIMRTLAHEMVHFKQDCDGSLTGEDGRTGSNIENDANAMAGIILREFAQQFPEYFLLPSIR